MGELQERKDDDLTRRDESGVPAAIYWIVAGIAFLGIGLLVVFLGPWLLGFAAVLVGLWLAWKIFQWWSSDDDPAEQQLISHESSDEARLGSEIALEDLRSRSENKDST